MMGSGRLVSGCGGIVIAVTHPCCALLATMDGCNMGVMNREWLGVSSAKALTPAWTICYQC